MRQLDLFSFTEEAPPELVQPAVADTKAMHNNPAEMADRNAGESAAGTNYLNAAEEEPGNPVQQQNDIIFSDSNITVKLKRKTVLPAAAPLSKETRQAPATEQPAANKTVPPAAATAPGNTAHAVIPKMPYQVPAASLAMGGTGLFHSLPGEETVQEQPATVIEQPLKQQKVTESPMADSASHGSPPAIPQLQETAAAVLPAAKQTAAPEEKQEREKRPPKAKKTITAEAAAVLSSASIIRNIEPVSATKKRGRKSFKEIDAELDLVNVPEEEELFAKQYYPISIVAGWFNVNTSLLRYWENEFDILRPRKNRKGDRLFRPEDVKNLQVIYYLLRQRKFTIEGAKEYLKSNRKKADTNTQLVQSLTRFRSFLLEMKAQLHT